MLQANNVSRLFENPTNVGVQYDTVLHNLPSLHTLAVGQQLTFILRLSRRYETKYSQGFTTFALL